MKASDFPLTKYLERIELSAAPKPDEEGLRLVHTAQAFSIPFENLDIHLGRAISLEPADLVEKIVRQKRGGYCFELNGLLHQALNALGFSVQPHMARVLYGRDTPGGRTHEVLIVTIDGGKWLADTGFGGPGLRSPIPLIENLIYEQCKERYRLRRDPELGLVLQKETHDILSDLYAFNLEELTLDVDLEMGNHFTSTSPLSIFRLRRMCSLLQPWGRITLNDMELSVHRNGRTSSHMLSSGSEYLAAISRHFGININNACYEDLLPLQKP